MKTTNTMVLGDNNVNVGIGLSTSTTGPLAKFHVFRDNTGTVSNPTAVYVENIDLDSRYAYMTGIKNITHAINEFNTGIYSDVYEGDNNTGGAFYAVHPANEYNIGCLGIADSGAVNIGIYGSAPTWKDPTYFNVGVYGEAPYLPYPGSQPTLGTGSYAGYFNGDVAVISN